MTNRVVQFFIFLFIHFIFSSKKIFPNPNIRNELETFSNLFNITYIKENTLNYDYLRVYLNNTRHKGLGVFASRRIPSNRTVSYYKLKIFDRNNYNRVGNGKYSIIVMKKLYGWYINDKNKVADIYAGSNQKPKSRIPFWGYLVNEPDPNYSPNCDLYLVFKKDMFEIGDQYIVNLISIKDIEPGEEITWCYGRNYKRNYVTGCGY